MGGRVDTEHQLRAVFAEVLNIDAGTITAEMSPDTVSGWDSFAMVSLVAAIEQKFAITFDFQELIEITTFGSVLEILSRKTEAAKVGA